MKNGICPKCSSHTIIENIPILDRSGQYAHLASPLSLAVQGERTGLFFSHVAKGELRAWVCGECGYTELYTSNLGELLEADREAKTADKK